MKKTLFLLLAMGMGLACQAADDDTRQGLTFDAKHYTSTTINVPTKGEVRYKAYTNLYYVTNIEDSTYQYLNVFIPEGATQQSPIFMPNNVAGYMAARPGEPNASGASGRALAEGYVVVIPGARGRNSVVTDSEGNKTYTGRAPKGLLDLKAAVRFLRLFDDQMPGNAEHIISDGTSAGGAMSSLLGATGNHPDYEPLLKAMGAADTRDDIFAAVCFCPITDLDHADMAYEWLYGATRQANDQQAGVSAELAALYPTYLNSLNLKTPEGTPLTADNYRDYIKQLLIESAQTAKDAGADIPDSIGFSFNGGGMGGPGNGGMRPGQRGGDRQRPQGDLNGERPQGQRPQGDQASERPQGQRPQGDLNGETAQGQRPQGDLNGETAQGQRPQGERPQMDGQNGPQGDRQRGNRRGGQMGGGRQTGEFVIDLDLDKYLSYVASSTPLKSAPAFDSKDVAGGKASAENEEFGDATGSSVNFTDYSLQKTTGDANATVDDDIKHNVRLINPMNYIGDPQAKTAQHWYIRHGTRDRDTSFNVPVNLALKLQNEGKDVDFKLAWNRPHSGDYALNEMFQWIRSVVK